MTNEPMKQTPAGVPVKPTEKPKQASGIDAFLQRTREMRVAERRELGRGRLIFALDATASRQPSWDAAMTLQSGMFQETASLDVQLVYYRGDGECKFSGWASDGKRLGQIMTGIMCRAGLTQIGKVLKHCCDEAQKDKTNKVAALVFIGDAFEENLDQLAPVASELGRLGVKAFMFQEGDDATVKYAFNEIARMTKGVYCGFDAGASKHLAELLRAVAAYVGGGIKALEAKAGSARMLTFFDK
jgi:hypothetical protein